MYINTRIKNKNEGGGKQAIVRGGPPKNVELPVHLTELQDVANPERPRNLWNDRNRLHRYTGYFGEGGRSFVYILQLNFFPI